MRVLFSRRSIDSDPDQTLSIFAGIAFVHALLCAVLFFYLTSYMFYPEFGACLIDPTRVVALNVLLIWFTIFAPAGVLVTLLVFGILCCPLITYQIIKQERAARQREQMIQMVLHGLVRRKFDAEVFRA
jgi:hypothetical protein